LPLEALDEGREPAALPLRLVGRLLAELLALGVGPANHHEFLAVETFDLDPRIGASGLPLASSIEQPTSPASAASLIVSATILGASPKPFSKSAETGRSVASQITRAWANASSRVTRPSRRPGKPADAPLEVATFHLRGDGQAR
jgi:hypothetical protein